MYDAAEPPWPPITRFTSWIVAVCHVVFVIAMCQLVSKVEDLCNHSENGQCADKYVVWTRTDRNKSQNTLKSRYVITHSPLLDKMRRLFLRSEKGALARGLKNISAIWYLLEMYCTLMLPFATSSLTKWKLISICLVPALRTGFQD